ncbi:MAG: four-helix bundle copper-binding protein, partial [Acidobacteriota bacterium]
MAHQHDMHGQSGSHMDPMMHVKTIDQVSKELQRCIKNCTDCHNICRDTATHSLERGGFDAIADHVWMLLDCAEICQTSAHFMMHNSPLHHATCGACAEVCEKCAE